MEWNGCDYERCEPMNKLKVTILSLSVVTVMAGAAVGPALGVIAEYFNGVSPLLIKLIITLPSLFIILTSFLFSAIANRASSKAIAIIGLLLYVAGGCGAGLADNVYVILGFRAVLGIGVGLIMPLSTGLLGYFFERSEQSKLMGYSVAMNNLGGIIASILAGYLVSLNWRYTFAIYLLGLIVILLVVLYLPKMELNRKKTGLDGETIRTIAPYALAMFVTMVAFYTMPSSFAIIAAAENLAPTAYVGLLMSAQNVTALIAGFLLSWILLKMEKVAKYFASAMMALGFLGMSFTGSVILTVSGLVALGIGMGTVVPILNAQIALRADKDKITSAMSIMSAMLFLGQFLSPIIIDGVQSLLGLQGVQSPYYLSMALSVLLCVSFIKVPISVAGKA